MNKISTSAKLIIAGPGAGKTQNMVTEIIAAIPHLSPCRYLAVITYTNSATNNILKRLGKQITIPENLFIGTMHSFLNKFIVLPFGSLSSSAINQEKHFMQCGLDDVFDHVERTKAKDQRSKSVQEAAIRKSAIKNRLNKLGYITFDQTLSIAKDCIANKNIAKIIANRIQFLFVDEFQDSGNEVFAILENIRKHKKTKIYCVGDPQQYIQSFDSLIRQFRYIPILAAADSKHYLLLTNDHNFRSTQRIVAFLNLFNGRQYKNVIFQQRAMSKVEDPESAPELGENVLFIKRTGFVTPILEHFYERCERLSIDIAKRCVLAKNTATIKRIAEAVKHKYTDPKKTSASLPIKVIQDTLLVTLQMNSVEFCERYGSNLHTLRKHAVSIFKAIQRGIITDENSYGNFVKDQLKLDVKKGLPVKIGNLTFDNNVQSGNQLTIANIHTIKGMEAEAVLAIAKSEEELLLWLETDHTVREIRRTNETTDYPRLGYVAFSRAERLLCIACLETITPTTERRLIQFNVEITGSLEKS